jgi:hypothetical protein
LQTLQHHAAAATGSHCQLECLKPRWSNRTVVVAATGPSLTASDLQNVRDAGLPLVVVNDAHRLAPWADVLYACDAAWWDVHRGAPGFEGERWSSHDPKQNDKLASAHRWGLRLVAGRDCDGLSGDPCCIHYGGNSGLQAINLATLWGASRLLLLGFDGGSGHFFGDHPPGLRNAPASRFRTAFALAARSAPVPIINCTPTTELACFPRMRLNDALA